MNVLLSVHICFLVIGILSFCNAKYCEYRKGITFPSKENCTDLEHCVNDTFEEDTGQCLGKGNQCEPGWMGPGCQYVNMAYHSLNDEDEVLDGNLSTKRPLQSINISFPGIFIVTAVNFHSDDVISRLIIGDDTATICYDGEFMTSSATAFCHRSLRTSVLTITFNESLMVREIEVFGGKNIALWKITEQSSDYNESGILYTSDKAVDGSDGNHQFSSQACSHTNDDSPQWSVRLGGYYLVLSILIANRNDTQNNNKRIDGFRLYGKDISGSEKLIYDDENPPMYGRPDIWIDSSHILPMSIKEIVIKGNTTRKEKILNICEVYVFACNPTKDGMSKCNDMCPPNCEQKDSCVNFACLRCLPGWSGPYCQQKKRHPKYCEYHQGRDFENSNNCTALEHCYGEFNVSDGRCKSHRYQCEPGWMGHGCQYVNLAFNKTNGDIFDGNFTTSRQITNATVQFDGLFIVSALRIHVNSRLHVDLTIEDHANILCYNGNFTATSTIYFKRVVKTDRLFISFNDSVNVQEIQVFGGKNIALWRPTKQSSTYGDTWKSANAVDGWGASGDVNKHTCSHTVDNGLDQHPTWNVTLGGYYSITSIHIVNRNELQLQINNFLLYGKQRDGIQQIYNDSPKNLERRNDIWIDSRYWKPEPVSEIIIDGRNINAGGGILTLCEVFVFACRPLENNDDECVGFCPQNCIPSELCLNENFTCPECISGWKGDYCDEAVVQCGANLSEFLRIDPLKPNYTYMYNETITFSCKEGYVLEGDETATCGQDHWSVSQFPICRHVQCRANLSKFIKIDPLKPNYTYMYNETITFSCMEGYLLEGDENATCGRDHWSVFQFPICRQMSEQEKSKVAVIAGAAVGTSFVLIIPVLVITIIIVRKRKNKEPILYKDLDEGHSLETLDHVYAKVQKITKNPDTEPPRLPSRNIAETSTYYNLNSKDAEKAKSARQEVYYEFSPSMTPSSTAIKVSEFKNYVDKFRGNKDIFGEQFKKFYTGLQFPATAAVKQENVSKNKYKNIYPYDDTRVKLKIDNRSPKSDYINASFIHGYGYVKHYIAAQGPLVDTIDDFWWMVWNEKCGKIVMLTNIIEDDKVKCIHYWPDKYKMIAGNIKIEMVDEENFSDFTIRTFCMKYDKENRIIRQFHFTAWPDKGVPLYASSLVHFHSKVKNTTSQGNGPLIVHCSAGIGRTGTFVALDYLIQQAKESDYLYVFGCVETLRRQRVNMVQTVEQYIFLHNALLEALMCTSSDPTTTEFPQLYRDLIKIDPYSGKRNIEIHFENLLSGIEEVPDTTYSFAKELENKMKNRDNNILPVDSEMPELRDEENKRVYINAIFLPAYRTKRSFIVTQMPLRKTVNDFWRLIADQNVSTIVMLNQTEPEMSNGELDIGIYWPEGSESREYSLVSVSKEGSSSKEKDYTVIDLSCKTKDKEDKEEDKRIRIFKCNFWPDSETIPSSTLSFLKLVHAVELHHARNNTGPVVVHCLDGSEKSGLFCVLQVVLERMKIEQDVAIHQVIQQMRTVRPSIIPNVAQFEFCHDVVMEFLKQYDAYSNFQGH